MISTNARIDSTASIGVDVHIADGVIVGRSVRIGRAVRIESGTTILGPCTIGDECIISAGCTIDPSADSDTGTLTIEAGVKLMPGVAIASKIRIATGACVRTGTIITRSIPPHAIVDGNPAQIVGYTLSHSTKGSSIPVLPPQQASVWKSSVAGVTLHRLQKVLDLRGNLTVGEFERTVPFAAKRYFMVFGVPNTEIRGEHAHRTCHQFLICAHGRCSVVADDGLHREEFLLDDPSVGIHLPPLTWGVQYKYSEDAVLLVFASEHYDNAEYIREYSEFIQLVARDEVSNEPS